jgi:hypothetical protein
MIGSQPAIRAAINPANSHMTHRWRGMDSKFQFRDASPLANSVGAFSAVEWWLLEPPKQLYRFAKGRRPLDANAATAFDRPQPDQASRPLPIVRGTEMSNPFRSSGESRIVGAGPLSALKNQ